MQGVTWATWPPEGRDLLVGVGLYAKAQAVALVPVVLVAMLGAPGVFVVIALMVSVSGALFHASGKLEPTLLEASQARPPVRFDGRVISVPLEGGGEVSWPKGDLTVQAGRYHVRGGMPQAGVLQTGVWVDLHHEGEVVRLYGAGSVAEARAAGMTLEPAPVVPVSRKVRLAVDDVVAIWRLVR